MRSMTRMIYRVAASFLADHVLIKYENLSDMNFGGNFGHKRTLCDILEKIRDVSCLRIRNLTELYHIRSSAAKAKYTQINTYHRGRTKEQTTASA